MNQNTLDSASIVGGGGSDGVQQQHMFLPFFGGPDGRIGLRWSLWFRLALMRG
jgi:hypothetical protein